MSRIVKVSQSDYRLQVRSGGSITLDTGTSTLSATSIIPGQNYTIATLGNTNYIAAGAPSNTVGITFKANSTPTGTGTVTEGIGTVTVIGNLDVRGKTTTIESTVTTIADNTIQLNVGQTGNGISAALNYQSGIQITRGAFPDAKFVFDDSVTHYNPIPVNATSVNSFNNTVTLESTTGLLINSAFIFQGTNPFPGSNIVGGTTYYIKTIASPNITISATSGGVTFDITGGIISAVAAIEIIRQPGTFVINHTDGTLAGIQTNSITTAGTTDLVLDFKNANNVLRVTNLDPEVYATRVAGELPHLSAPTGDELNDNIIPNRRWVTDYVAAGGYVVGQADVDRYYKRSSGVIQSEGIASAPGNVGILEFKIRSNGTLNVRGKFTASGLTVDNVNTFNNTITNISSFDNLILSASNNQIEVTGVLNLDYQSGDPAYGSLTNRVYSKPPGTGIGTPGKSGLYFVNTLTTDELVAKNRALLFSMLF
jgi:hypothetical protein